MNLEHYFSEKQGVGVLSTANGDGEVNGAIYAKPHVLTENTIAFIMRNKLTRANLLENSSANYLFMEHEHGFHGIRMYLEKMGEERDKDKIGSMSRRSVTPADDVERFLVTFRVKKILVLVGDKELPIH